MICLRLVILAVSFLIPVPIYAQDKAEHVIIISFDGLRPDAITTLGLKEAPNFHEVMKTGAYTLNARTDPDWTVTMPNHTCMLTGRGVDGVKGHNYTDNSSADLSIHANKGSYVPSIFDVAKAHNLSTGFFVSKSKFQVFANSYGKYIDVVSINGYDDTQTLQHFLGQIRKDLPNVTFIHFSEPDRTGHHHGWSIEKGSPYLAAVRRDDHNLGEIIKAIRGNPAYLNSTVVMMTADHGGRGLGHGDFRLLEDYRIPLIIWGKGVATGSDLYRINVDIRQDPRDQQVSYGDPRQPIRNGDVANAVLHILGLPAITGSTIGDKDPIRIAPNEN
jgi:predicted AlkP superfamily pyrophosphatase or phosphodiesterase